MSDSVANCAKTLVDGFYVSGDTAITVLSPERFPAAPFTVLWWNATDYADPSDDPSREFVRVVSVVSNVFHVTRGVEGTSASDKNVSDKTYKMIAGITAAMWANILTRLHNLDGL